MSQRYFIFIRAYAKVPLVCGSMALSFVGYFFALQGEKITYKE
jgi:hypothetical protein